MGEPLIWTCEDIVRFTYEPDFYDRAWAWCWLQRHHPAEVSRHAARAILDPSPSVVALSDRLDRIAVLGTPVPETTITGLPPLATVSFRVSVTTKKVIGAWCQPVSIIVH